MTALARKIAALEAKAASTTFPHEAETCRRLADKLRRRAAAAGTINPVSIEAAEQDLQFAAAWAAKVLKAHSCDDFDLGEGLWAVPGSASPLSSRELVQRAIDLGHRPLDHGLQASTIVAMGWNV